MFHTEILSVLMLCCRTEVSGFYIIIIDINIIILRFYMEMKCFRASASVWRVTERTSRAWELNISIQHFCPHRRYNPPPPSFSCTHPPRVSRARTRAKLRGNGCLCDRGGWAARSERWAAWVCNVRHVGYGVLNRRGTAAPRKKIDR